MNISELDSYEYHNFVDLVLRGQFSEMEVQDLPFLVDGASTARLFGSLQSESVEIDYTGDMKETISIVFKGLEHGHHISLIMKDPSFEEVRLIDSLYGFALDSFETFEGFFTFGALFIVIYDHEKKFGELMRAQTVFIEGIHSFIIDELAHHAEYKKYQPVLLEAKSLARFLPFPSANFLVNFEEEGAFSSGIVSQSRAGYSIDKGGVYGLSRLQHTAQLVLGSVEPMNLEPFQAEILEHESYKSEVLESFENVFRDFEGTGIEFIEPAAKKVFKYMNRG
tara:strand:+ start:59056 stop:59895 length:840 start_codon:yes stop_codon:yes gene_type:complete